MTHRPRRVRRTLGLSVLVCSFALLATLAALPGCVSMVFSRPEVVPWPDPAGSTPSPVTARQPTAPEAARPNPAPIVVTMPAASPDKSAPVPTNASASIIPAAASVSRASVVSAVRYEVTAAGIASVQLNGQAVADGGWSLVDAAEYFPADAQAVAVGPVLRSTVEALGNDTWRVVHEHRDVKAVYDYVARGEDMTVRVEVTNHSANGKALKHMTFSGLTVRLPENPADTRVSRRHPSYFQSRQWDIAHPSYYSPLGAWMLRGGTVNLAFVPLDAAMASKLLMGNYDTTGSKSWRLIYMIRQGIDAGQAGVVRMTLRLSANGEWSHLLEPYKAEFDKTFPQAFYTGDARPVGMCAASADKRITPANPLGFAADMTRFDLDSGVRQFLTGVGDPLQMAGAQGCIFWDMQGFNTRGAMYRPDFDVFPASVKANVPALIAGMKSRGLKVGMLGRPGDVVVPASATQDTTRRVSSTDAAAMEAMWSRFNTVIDMGVTDFYLDTFGNMPDDVRIMALLRQKMREKGVNCLTYAEFGVDVMLPYSGFYTEVRYDEQKRMLDFGPYTNLEDVRIMRWLMPGMVAIAQVRASQPPEAVWQFCMREKILPMVSWWDIKAKSGLMRSMTDRYVDPATNWWR
ncbi:MAG: hypothetical protein NTW19_24845 [Planctomycetota bacterium]|nr:hypothetical protein [Planctomycetota bacterium]